MDQGRIVSVPWFTQQFWKVKVVRNYGNTLLWNLLSKVAIGCQNTWILWTLGVTSMHFLLTVSNQNWTRTSWELRKWSLTKEGLDLLNKFSLSALYGLENIWRMVWKIWIKILGCKELMWLSMYPLFRGQTWQCLIERVCDIVTWNRGSSVIFISAQLILT